MGKVLRYEKEGMMHCRFYPSCLFSRNVQVSGVAYPRKAAQQFILKHEKQCLHNPSHLPSPNTNTINNSNTNTNTATLQINSNNSDNSNNNTPLNIHSTTTTSWPATYDFVVLYRWKDKYKCEARMRNATLVGLSLQTRGFSVWAAKVFDVSSEGVFVSLEQALAHCKLLLVLLHPSDLNAVDDDDDNMMKELVAGYKSSKPMCMLLFDANNLDVLLPPKASTNDILVWLRSSPLCTTTVKMKSFSVLTNHLESILKQL